MNTGMLSFCIIHNTSMILPAYDVQENADIFFKDTPNGVSHIVVGKFGKNTEPLAIIGGNGSVHGFDHQGNEVFWNVVGDDVKSMILMDYDKDGTNEVSNNFRFLNCECTRVSTA